ncbi:penicillin-binding transpeptidase domain-containing protein [Spongiactinospora sp. TRM90649]|uniref:peptidoglycan D,D-transpeptidase FtsI family protein n=1 Tax=Spongiactinospora sp. TRM90649 TaxID=3031114 RepID=UPI0023F843DD|nr:penicillin-binding transpeptidase domain-containing protein [Spongiactinospora sp. TRM90649]MDF5752978.1 penicillin-binding transpeptidase domain-containing protein [Spongiactinospora sp. TRM90649]
MNGPLKRAALACLLMFGLLMANINYLQAVRAEGLRDDARNKRNFYARYDVERGRITAGREVLAESVEKEGQFRFVRNYPKGPLYAHITGYFSPESQSAIESARNSLLDGSDPSLLIRRSIDLFTNKASKGANVDLTILPKAQEAAYNALRQSGKRGAVVALDPETGAILAMVSLPTFDPNELSGVDKGAVFKRYDELDKAKNRPLINRAIGETYPPGSTFKVLTAAAFLEDDSSRNASTMVDAPQRLDLPNTTADLPNYGGAACGAGRVTLVFALERSCNTPFGKIGIDLGYEKMKDQATKFGIGGERLTVPMGVAESSIGPEEDAAALAQASIGQRSVQMTPLEMALIAAGIANDGKVMKPYLVNRIADAEGGEVENADPDELSTAMSSETAAKLREMMVSVVRQGTATAAQIPGVEVGGKTGTAETAEGQAPHAWFISFAPAQKPKVAVAVLVESGSAGTDASGGHTAAPIAKSVMEAVLGR